MKRILFFTSARSDFGTIKLLIKQSTKPQWDMEPFLLVSGSHFLKSKGYTYTEIEEENLLLEDHVFQISNFSEEADAHTLCTGIGKTLVSISDLLLQREFDGIIIFGDRYELFTLTVPALMHKVPLFHISGGEVTEGAIDDSVRHATTKLSHIHLVANKHYAKNISLMGEEDWRIQIVGECDLDNLYTDALTSKEEISEKFGIDLNAKVILVTFHPSTLDEAPIVVQINSLLSALENFVDKFQIVFTAPGNEIGADYITNRIREFICRHPNCRFVDHLGSRNYLTVLKNSQVIVGNSSSGIVEAPSLCIPSVDVGSRQKNRLAAKSVVHVGYNSDEIVNGIRMCLSEEFRNGIKDVDNPYDPYKDGRGSERAIRAISNALNMSKEKLLIKRFDNSLNSKEWNYLLRGDMNEK